MSKLDVIIRGGTLITHEGVRAADVAIADGKIVALGERLADPAVESVDARGLHIFSGLIVRRGLRKLGDQHAGSRWWHDVLRHAAQFVPAHAGCGGL